MTKNRYVLGQEAIDAARNKANNLFGDLDKFDSVGIDQESFLTNILVVDDEQIMRTLLHDILAEEGYNVSAFASAEEALKVVNTEEADIVITDLKMKGMDGIELLKKTKEISPNTDVIVITGYASVQTAVDSMKLGAIDYLNKPLRIDQIKFIVERTLKNREIKRQANESNFYKKLSQLDSMTELFNHQFFQQLLSIEIARAERETWPISLMMIDIDDFELFNDKNSYSTGDVALKKVSWLIKDNSRSCDFVARYGGEEFAVIVPNIGKYDAQAVANRMRKAVEDTRFKHEEVLPQGTFTVSIGIAEFPSDAANRAKLIEAAKRALNTAKSEGKNKVCIYPNPCN